MRVLIMAGGTGGHVIPALSIARLLREQGHEILWLGTRGRMEEQLVPAAGFDIAYIEVQGLRRNGIKRKLTAPFMILHAMAQAFGVIRRFKPALCIGMGGYASGPGGLVARLCGIPLVLHEQNAAAGLTNRLLFKVCTQCLLGFKGAFTGPKTTVTGNPVRPEIAALHDFTHDFLKDNTLHVLIVGGSLGAQALNQKLPGLLAAVSEPLLQQRGLKLAVHHQCGKGNSASVQALYEKADFACEVSDFITDMAAAYKQADCIICRAGALTVAEVAAAGVPALFVPLPTAVDDHQTKNAASLVQAGGALLIAQKDLTEESFSQAVLQTLSDKAKLQQMAAAMKQAAVLDAPQRICAQLQRYLQDKKA